MKVRRAVRMGLWVVIAFSALTMPAIWHAEKVLVFAGQDPHVAKLAGDYLQIAGWGIFPGLAFMVLRSFLSAVGHAGFILYVTLIILVFNAVCAYGLVLGHYGLPALGMFGGQLLGRNAEFACGRMQGVQTLLDHGKPLRVEIDALRVVRERVNRLAKLDLGGLERGERVGESGVDLGQFADLVHHVAQRRDDGAVGFGQRVERALHAVDETCCVRQTPMLGAYLVPLAFLRIELVEFGRLPFEALAFELQLAVAPVGFLATLDETAPLPVRGRGVGGQRRGAGVRVEQPALGVGAKQLLVSMLAVNVDEHLAELAELRERGGRAVDEGARAAAGIEHAAQQHAAVLFQRERLRLQPGFEIGARFGVGGELRGDVGARLPGAHHAGVATLAHGQGQRVDQDRFARAGLPREHGETGGEFQVETIDDHEIANRETA